MVREGADELAEISERFDPLGDEGIEVVEDEIEVIADEVIEITEPEDLGEPGAPLRRSPSSSVSSAAWGC